MNHLSHFVSFSFPPSFFRWGQFSDWFAICIGLQEARRAAEKAYDVGKVDERVNRAVAAANRAANAARVAAIKAVQKQMQRGRNNDNMPVTVV